MNLESLRYRLVKYRITLAQKRELEIKLKEVEELIGLKAVTCDSIGSSSGISKSTENQAIKLLEIKEKLEYTIEHKGLECRRIENALSILSPIEREIIELKYIEEHVWDTVTYKVKKSKSTCKRVEFEALNKMQELLNYSV